MKKNEKKENKVVRMISESAQREADVYLAQVGIVRK